MTWEKIYLVCFVVGFSLSGLSFLLGVLHLPHFHFPGGRGGLPHVGAHGTAHAAGGRTGTSSSGTQGTYEVSPFNFATLLIFLAWFGGTGYLLTHYGRLWGLVTLLYSVLTGLAGAAAIFWFMAKVLVRPDENFDPADYVMVGTLGRLTVGIREGGTGEIVYSQGGTRKSAGARSEDARPIEKGTEVVVTRYEKGIAYVRRWDELNAEVESEKARGAEQH